MKIRASILVVSGLLWPGTALAAVFNVPSGACPTIQSGIDAAIGTPGVNEVRVGGGRYLERVHITAVPADSRLIVSGGWSHSFDRVDGSISTIDAGGAGVAVSITSTRGAVSFRRFTITGAAVAAAGGTMPAAIKVAASRAGVVNLEHNVISGNALTDDRLPLSAVRVEVRNTARVSFYANEVRDNSVTAKGGTGAGLHATVNGPGELVVEANRFIRNYLRATDGVYVGQAAAADLSVVVSARLRLAKNLFSENKLSARGVARSGALRVYVHGSSSASVYANIFENNRAESDTGAADRTVSLGVSGEDGARPRIDAVRNSFTGNTAGGATKHMLGLTAVAGDIRLADSLVVGGDSGAIHSSASRGGMVTITNVTIAGNAGGALRVVPRSTGEITNLSNSILFGNGTDAPVGTPFMTANLIGVDPLFVGDGDYRLRAGSLAIGGGNALPPGGLSSSDLVGHSRVLGAAVDIGAYEQ